VSVQKVWLGGTLAVALVGLMVVGLAFPALAAPGRQDDDLNLPTPTPAPVEQTPYTLTVVGGEAQTLTFDHGELDGFVLGETTVTSAYPRGMVFTINPTSKTGDIQDVILFIRFVHGSGTRVVASWDESVGAWVSRPWQTGEGQPAWTHFEFTWRVRDTSGASVDTEPIALDYADPSREWFRMESDLVVLYWFGFGEDDPDAVAQRMADSMAATQERRVQGFGRPLSYKPVAVVYPSRDGLAEIYGSGVANNRVAGFTSSDLGMSVQVLRGTELVPGNENCIYALQPDEWTMERRIETIYSTTTHEVVHLYQYDILGGPLGPLWWTEGQPEWHSIAPGLYDRRLRHLGTLQDIPSLTTDIGSNLTQADGCYALAYDVGPSFINFLVTHYGGIDTHRQIAELMRTGPTVYEAVEQVTGKPFLEVENEWRVYLGLAPLSLADVDPAQALEPFEDNLIAVGDTITLPATPMMSPLAEKPGPKALASAQCFANTAVTVLNMGMLEDVPYYEIDCMGMTGWVTRDQLVGPQN